MRCLYCGALNRDNAQHCAYCGRTFPRQGPAVSPTPLPQRPPVQPPQRPGTPLGVPMQAPAYPSPAQNIPAPSYPAAPTVPPNIPAARRDSRRRRPVDATAPVTPDLSHPPVQATPEPPVAFPPRSIAQLNALQQGAIAYSVLDESVNYGRRKIVRIVFPRCSAWQQVATLLKALTEFRSEKFETIIIQGLFEHNANVYTFNNGQLQFDQKVRLGSQILNRYQIDTENGFSSSSIRIVLTEP